MIRLLDPVISSVLGWLRKKLFGKEENLLKKRIEKMQEVIEGLKEKLKNMVKVNNILMEKNQELVDTLNTVMSANDLEELDETAKYWNNKYEKSSYIPVNMRPMLGPFRHYLAPFSILKFCQPSNYFRTVLKKKGLTWEKFKKKGKSMDDLALAIFKWRIGIEHYRFDKYQFGFEEYWLLPEETFALKAGDCEDTANEMISFFRSAGIPSWRVRNVCGDTKYGGHSTVHYYTDSGRWVQFETTIDSCRYETISDVPSHDQDEGNPLKITSVWWAFNDKYFWKDWDKKTKASVRKARKRGERLIKLLDNKKLSVTESFKK